MLIALQTRPIETRLIKQQFNNLQRHPLSLLQSQKDPSIQEIQIINLSQIKTNIRS